MGVFKWLRRERVTVSSRSSPTLGQQERRAEPEPVHEETVGTIRTDTYKRDLAEFQARRTSGNRDILQPERDYNKPSSPRTPTTPRVSPQISDLRTPDKYPSDILAYSRALTEFQARRVSADREIVDTPVKKSRSSRLSLPVSCTGCTAGSPDKSFNYEKKSAAKYKKNKQRRAQPSMSDEKMYEGLPNVQFLFQNQVFMPGHAFPTCYSEPQRVSRYEGRRQNVRRTPDLNVLKTRQLDFHDDEEKVVTPPLFHKTAYQDLDSDGFEVVRGAGDATTDNSSHSDELENHERFVSCEDKLMEVMNELKHFDQWADDQLRIQSLNSTRCDENKSNASIYGLPIVDDCKLEVNMDRGREWNPGQWGVMPVQIKKLNGVTMAHIKKKKNVEVDLLKKCRHPNMVLLMGFYPDMQQTVHLVCEHFIDTLYNILHVRGPILTAQKSVEYAADIASALVFLHMRGYIHTGLDSSKVVITSHDAAKLSDLAACAKYLGDDTAKENGHSHYNYSPEPQYVNIEATRKVNSPESEPLITLNPSETYLIANAVGKDYEVYRSSARYRWQAPELFDPDELGKVYPCTKSDVYSLCLILWECCNAAIPWKSLSYAKLKDLYLVWKTGIRLPKDGSYPGSLLDLLQAGLSHQREPRPHIVALADRLAQVKRSLADLPDIIIPARLTNKRSDFSSVAWESTSPSDSDIQSPPAQNLQQLAAVVHTPPPYHSPETDSEKEIPRHDDSDPETQNTSEQIKTTNIEKCYQSDDESVTGMPTYKYNKLQEKEFSSACSTPITKVRAKIKSIGTPGANFHRSDSTEYCSIFSPNRTTNIGLNDTENNTQSPLTEHPTAKLSRSFTPKSYKPLHIKVPNYGNLDCIKALRKNQNESNSTPTYNFDIKNYSLPNTPIARSNKLRKNAWLSGEFNSNDKDSVGSAEKVSPHSLTTARVSISSDEKTINDTSPKQTSSNQSQTSDQTSPTLYNGYKKTEIQPEVCASEVGSSSPWERGQSWSYKSSVECNVLKSRVEDDALASMCVKPLVAIHERWIYEANKKTGRSMSLPDDNRCHIPAMKPASHCVSTLQNSLPQLNSKRPYTAKYYRSASTISSGSRNGAGLSEQFSQARDYIAKSMSFSNKEPTNEENNFWKTEATQCSPIKENPTHHDKVDQATDTRSIEEFIKDLIRKEFCTLIQEVSDDSTENKELIDKGATNVLEALKCNTDAECNIEKDQIQSFSRIKINGNNKPLLQITFTKTGENSLQVLDNCVNVNISEGSYGGKCNEDTLSSEEYHSSSLKRCQAFNALQEARSTEDLYIDDELSTHMQDNFCKMKLIPLHGSLHEILCEKEDECCLIKVKQENGCDTIYFRCDNSDTESRDAIDGGNDGQDTVVFKRSISLIEERIQRIIPKDKRPTTPVAKRKVKRVDRDDGQKLRPKSEIFEQNVYKEMRILSNSTPSLINKEDKIDEVEVNLEQALCYQDSSSDECVKCRTENDEFEQLEKKIEHDLALSTLTCGCLEKISEENLSMIEDSAAKEHISNEGNSEVVV